MAPQSKTPYTLVLLLFSTLFFLPSHGKNSNDDFNQFEGYRKGQKGLLPIKTYLHRYGYLDSFDPLDRVQMFDDALESAILTYQQNFHLNPTGTLDSETLAVMMAPRCGCPDIINGTNTMARNNKNSKYTLYIPQGKWDKFVLKVAFTNTLTPQQQAMVAQGFAEWQKTTMFRFNVLPDADHVLDEDVRVEMLRGDHGDGFPFDGPEGTLAHSFGPHDGRLHFDADESWADGAKPGFYDMTSVAVHEMGHVLGLGHTNVKEAVMFPKVEKAQVKRVPQRDDLDGIAALYSGGTVKPNQGNTAPVSWNVLLHIVFFVLVFLVNFLETK